MLFNLFNDGDSMSLEDFKANLTDEKKTTYGIIGIVLGALFWGIGQPYLGIMDIFLLILPSIFLALPSQTTKNNKGLAIISGIILAIAFFVLFFGYFYNPLSPILQLILCIYGFFCVYIMTIPTDPKQQFINSSNMTANYNQKYDKYCSECGHGLFNDAQFCSKCGAKVTNVIHEDVTQDADEESNENICSECGQELEEDSKFCPECGVEVINVIHENSSQDNDGESSENVCSECGQELREDSKFCPECGKEVTTDVKEEPALEEDENNEKHCNSCGHELFDDSKFCPECGAKVSDLDD